MSLPSPFTLFVYNNQHSMAAIQNTLPGCIFCKIATQSDPATDVVFRNERMCIFKDIRPASDFHYLAIPNHHVENVNSLTVADKPLLAELKRELVNFMESNDVDLHQTCFGFHMPPFTSVKHLHLHAIAPVGRMGFISRMIFRPNTMWFKTDEAIMQAISSEGSSR
ncbi:adenosine 5'-monophosphoramidase HINT3-like [Anopheles moucheti]|uniref:adenosine 5'-monophosphoramidase HINT3-like n=1 Tax=Anopheles moucheti TaxID=186751 RepID=UPI0022F0F76F|nr:adenosine 5'-monophosphoramidase HINT3-like [Anopheles moucheti]